MAVKSDRKNGSEKEPIYRIIVVGIPRSLRNGRFIERDRNLQSNTDPSEFKIDEELGKEMADKRRTADRRCC